MISDRLLKYKILLNRGTNLVLKTVIICQLFVYPLFLNFKILKIAID
jgi:hypothetical protein